MNREVVIKLFKKVARILEDDKQYEWLADEVKDYLNEMYVDEELEVKQEPLTNEQKSAEAELEQSLDERIRRIVINSISRIG